MMRQMLFIVLVASLLSISNGLGQTSGTINVTGENQKNEKSDQDKIAGFVDKNSDGINDVFRDANGDGKNDLNGKPYPHKFKYDDQNNDKRNDFWIDRDGDGVNDLGARFTESQRRERHLNVLDVNEDNRNDITGEKYDPEKHLWHGETWGFWDETAGKLQGNFWDENGDGIDDRLHDFDGFVKGHHSNERQRDMFIDEDGDGICDDRMDFLNQMGRHGRKGTTAGGGKKHGGHH